MSIYDTARIANFRDSIKKYFVDGLGSIEVTFDKSLSIPKIQGNEIEKWVVISFGLIERGNMSSAYVELVPCTRRDPEGFKLAQLSDTLYNLVKDSAKTDGMKRIPLYKSYPNQAWELIGSILVTEIREAEEMDNEDLTKFKIITLRLQWPSTV